MPIITDGGIFVPSESDLPSLMARVFLILKLPTLDREAAISGRVIWLNPNPPRAGRYHKRGYGLQMTSGSEEVGKLIEGLLIEDEQDTEGRTTSIEHGAERRERPCDHFTL